MVLGNAWHLPGNPEPRGNAGMRDPVFPTDPVPTVTVFSGNQFQGGGNAGNQLQNGSVVLFKQATATAWQTVPLIFAAAIGNNKYYSAELPTGVFPTAPSSSTTSASRRASTEVNNPSKVAVTLGYPPLGTFAIGQQSGNGIGSPSKDQWSRPGALTNVLPW